jgi:hypothetical protein
MQIKSVAVGDYRDCNGIRGLWQSCGLSSEAFRTCRWLSTRKQQVCWWTKKICHLFSRKYNVPGNGATYEVGLPALHEHRPSHSPTLSAETNLRSATQVLPRKGKRMTALLSTIAAISLLAVLGITFELVRWSGLGVQRWSAMFAAFIVNMGIFVSSTYALVEWV